MEIDENYLLFKVATVEEIQEGIKKMVNAIKSNESYRKDVVLVHKLKKPVNIIPKAKIEEKEATKWSEFAKEKGIETKKKSFFVYNDDGNKEHRYGALSAKNKKLRCGIYEKGMTYSKLRKEKLARITKNKESMQKNVERRKKTKQQTEKKNINK
ncbi:hypothetical protein BDAP_000678 [Binucleata daphniae]